MYCNHGAMKFLIILLIFCGTSSAIFLHCLHTYVINDWAEVSDVCDVLQVNSTQNSTHLTGFEPTYGLETAEDFDGLQFNCFFRNYEIQNIPLGITKILPNVVGLEFRGCSMEELSGIELNEIPRLRWFTIIFSPALQRIPGNLFE